MVNMSHTLPIIDLAKYICALCVIAIHAFTTSPIENTGVLLFINGIARISIPFFFCCTGYFLAKKGIDNKEAVLSYIKKLLKVYLIWSMVYIPIELLKMIGTNSFDFPHILHYLQSIFVQGSFLHLWYFPAVILAAILLHLLLKKISLSKLCLFAIFLYAFGMLGDSYIGILDFLPSWAGKIMKSYQNIFISTRNGLFFGFPMMLMGVLICRFENKLRKFNFSPYFVLCLFMICIETYLLNKFDFANDYNMTFAVVPATFFLFILLLNCRVKLNINSYKLRQYSILLYECHLVFYGILLALMTVIDVAALQYGIIRFLIVFTASQCYAFLALKLSAKKSRKRVRSRALYE